MATKHEILDKAKTPKHNSKSNYLGIEIEFIAKANRSELRNLLVESNLHKHCQAKSDGSIDSFNEDDCPHRHECEDDLFDDWYGECKACTWEDKQSAKWRAHELTILVKEEELKDVLNKVNVILKKTKAKVNDSCGLHVHIDMRNRSFETVVNNFMEKQNEMRSIVSKSRQNSMYCRPLSYEDITLNKIYPGNVPRYKDINITAYHKFKTIEIRLHEGCVSTREIYSWCNYLVAIADKKPVRMAYVQQRYKKCL